MYKVTNSMALNGRASLPSKANAAAGKNIKFTKKVLVSSLAGDTYVQTSVYDLAKVTSAQKEYQENLWESVSGPNATPSLFTAIKNSWDLRKT